MRNKHKILDKEKVRVIKIGKQALYEFIYEKFIEDQENYFDVNSLDVEDTFDINFERGDFIFCVHRDEDKKGKSTHLPQEVDLQKLMEIIPDTTSSMFNENRYKDYTIDELIELSKQ